MSDELKLAVAAAVMGALESVGLEKFRQTSMFMSNRPRAQAALAA